MINDIEDITSQRWPASLALPMPPIRATCADHTSGAVASYAMDWSLGWQTSLRAFLLGRRTAIADLFGSVQAIETSSPGGPLHLANPAAWSETAVDYSFAPASSEVPAQDGTTGVSDLGDVLFTTKAGSFWGDAMSIRIDMTSFAWCTVDSETFVNDGTGAPVVVRKPIASTAAADILAEGIRDQFRSAVRIAVTGSP